MRIQLLSMLKTQIYYSTSNINPKCKVLKNNIDLLQVRTSDSAYILATGPSIKKMNLSLLEGHDCFSISNFFLHKDIKKIKPILHFFSPYHSPLIMQNYVDWLKKADDELPQETNIVLGLSNKYIVENYNLFPSRKVYYLDEIVSKKIRTDIRRPVTAWQTGPLMILPMVDYMGYKRINLIGCDMNVLKDYGTNVKNFYSQSEDPRKNATDKGVWCDGIIYNLECALNSFRQFEKYSNYLISRGKTMFNLSDESWIDFVEYKSLEESLKDDKKDDNGKI